MLFLYLVIDFLAHSANAQLSIDRCYSSSSCRLQNDSYSIYDTLARNCSSTDRTSNYWWYYKRNTAIQLNVNPKWVRYMDSSRYLLVLLPGLGEDFRYASTTQIKDAYFDKNDSVPQILDVDYNVGLTASPLYAARKGFCNYLDVAENLTSFIINLNKTAGFQLEDMHLIGVSFGAHLAGIIGYLLQTKYGYTPKRITGLAPLGAGYDCVTCPSLRLSKGDAKSVDVIHTNAGKLGALEKLGDIDFYVNWPFYSSYYSNITLNVTTDHGQIVDTKKSDAGFYFRIPSWIQPGCENSTDPDSCSVFRSPTLYAESVLRNRLRGSSCFVPSTLPGCVLTDYAYMGAYAPNSAMYKIYFVTTNPSPPYGRDPPGSSNNSRSPFGIGLPGLVTRLPGFGTGLPRIGTGLPGIGTGKPGIGTVTPPSVRWGSSGLGNISQSSSPSASGGKIISRIKSIGRTRTTIPSIRTTARSTKRRRFF